MVERANHRRKHRENRLVIAFQAFMKSKIIVASEYTVFLGEGNAPQEISLAYTFLTLDLERPNDRWSAAIHKTSDHIPLIRAIKEYHQ